MFPYFYIHQHIAAMHSTGLHSFVWRHSTAQALSRAYSKAWVFIIPIPRESGVDEQTP